MHRGLTLRDNGATAICPPQSAAFLAQISAISIISPLHQQHYPHPHPHPYRASASASFAALTKRRAVPAPCAVPACFQHVWRLLSARGSRTWRRTLSSQPGPVLLRGRGGGGRDCVPFALLFLCLQRGGAGRLILRLGEEGWQLAMGLVNTTRDGPREAATEGPRARWCREQRQSTIEAGRLSVVNESDLKSLGSLCPLLVSNVFEAGDGLFPSHSWSSNLEPSPPPFALVSKRPGHKNI